MVGPSALSIDFETRSTVDLRRQGLYRYAEDPTTDVLCMAYAWGGEEPKLWVPSSPPPMDIVRHVRAGLPMRAHNAQFERVIWREILGPRYGFPVPELEQWFCTAAEAAAMGLPRSLHGAAKALGVTHQKDDEGHRIMLQLCKPRRARKGEDPDGVYWWEDEEKYERLYAYCLQDVRAERAVAERVRRLSDYEREVYLLDQQVNDRGVQVDLELARAARRLVDRAMDRANEELQELTGGDVSAVTKRDDLLRWLERSGLELPDLTKATVRDTLDGEELEATVQRALEIRRDAAKSSTAKLDAMLRVAGSDGRARGLFLYHGASTGRDTGKLIQVQNLPRGEVKNAERFIPQVLAGEHDLIALEEPVLKVVSSLLRPMLVAPAGHRLIAADYAQIEARVLGWVAGEPYGDREYERMAALIYGVGLDEIENPSERRTVGKNTVLGCGYQMGAKTYQSQAKKATGLDLPTALCERAVRVYRENKPRIVAFWNDIERAAIQAVRRSGEVTEVGVGGPVRFVVRGEFLWCVLPSGRPLAYAKPAVGPRRTPWGEWVEGLSFYGVDGYTRKWRKRHAYGGLLTENVVQAMARDLLMAAMRRVERHGYPVVLRVHDELVADVPEGHGSLEEFLRLMAVKPRWAEGIPVEVEGWEGERYRK